MANRATGEGEVSIGEDGDDADTVDAIDMRHNLSCISFILDVVDVEGVPVAWSDPNSHP
jgi:hypothetical protein